MIKTNIISQLIYNDTKDDFHRVGDVIFNYFITTVIIEHKLKSVINGQWFSSLDIYHLDSLWFLWSVLCSSIVVAIAEKATKNLFIKIVVLALLKFACIRVVKYPSLSFIFNHHLWIIPIQPHNTIFSKGNLWRRSTKDK